MRQRVSDGLSSFLLTSAIHSERSLVGREQWLRRWGSGSGSATDLLWVRQGCFLSLGPQLLLGTPLHFFWVTSDHPLALQSHAGSYRYLLQRR